MEEKAPPHTHGIKYRDYLWWFMMYENKVPGIMASTPCGAVSVMLSTLDGLEPIWINLCYCTHCNPGEMDFRLLCGRDRIQTWIPISEIVVAQFVARGGDKAILNGPPPPLVLDAFYGPAYERFLEKIWAPLRERFLQLWACYEVAGKFVAIDSKGRWCVV